MHLVFSKCSAQHKTELNGAISFSRICYRTSVRPSVTRVDQSKTVKARITKFLPYSSPIPLVF